MQGLYFNLLENFVIQRYGEGTWKNIVQKAGYDNDCHLAFSAYDDESFYNLVFLGGQEVGATPEVFLENSGYNFVHWIKYSPVAFLASLDGLQLEEMVGVFNDAASRMAVSSPVVVPLLELELRNPSTLMLRRSVAYHHLNPLFVGMIKGLGRLWGYDFQFRQVGFEEEGSAFDEFEIEVKPWQKSGAA